MNIIFNKAGIFLAKFVLYIIGLLGIIPILHYIFWAVIEVSVLEGVELNPKYRILYSPSILIIVGVILLFFENKKDKIIGLTFIAIAITWVGYVIWYAM